MTRRDYQLIARALSSVRPDPESVLFFHQWKSDCAAIANALALDNPKFNHSRFLSACENTHP